MVYGSIFIGMRLTTVQITHKFYNTRHAYSMCRIVAYEKFRTVWSIATKKVSCVVCVLTGDYDCWTVFLYIFPLKNSIERIFSDSKEYQNIYIEYIMMKPMKHTLKW